MIQRSSHIRKSKSTKSILFAVCNNKNSQSTHSLTPFDTWLADKNQDKWRRVASDGTLSSIKKAKK